MKVMKTIKFYSINDEYGEFSNFAQFPIKIGRKIWPSTEHYFQAMKFQSIKDQEEIRKTKTPIEAARKGRDRKKKIKRDWNSIKESIMYDAVYAKFTQHSNLKELLISTKDAKLIEHTETNSYWGDGGDGKGKNRLGIILMKVRELLQNK